MAKVRILAAAACICVLGTAHAQLAAPSAGMGLNPAKASVAIGCGASLLPCADEAAALAERQNPSALRWSVEVAQPTFGPANRFSIGPARQGLSLSLLGQRRLGGSGFSVYGKLGTTYAAGEAPVQGYGGTEGAAGLSFGAGVSWDVTPRLSATFGLDNYHLRSFTGVSEPQRATSLGLQYRY